MKMGTKMGAHGRLGYALSERWRLDLVHREVDGSNDYDGCFGSSGPSGDCSSDYGMQASRLGLDREAQP